MGRRRLGEAVLLAIALASLGSVLALIATRSPGDGAHAVVRPGRGVFTFDGYEPLEDRPVRIFYEAPPGDLDTAQILVVIPGHGRDAESYRDDWHRYVDDEHVVVLVPEFSEDDYPGVSSYNLGNLVDEDGHWTPTDEWSFRLVDAMFSFVADQLSSSQRTYALFGHSAGGQFVHRMIEFMPDNHVGRAVAANAGWYTMPQDDVDFPYGLAGSPVDEKSLGPAFAQHLTVLLGADDIDPHASNLRRDDEADRQGETRLARGLAYYAAARATATERSLRFRWRLSVVPGLAHSHTDMAEAAAPLLLRETSAD